MQNTRFGRGRVRTGRRLCGQLEQFLEPDLTDKPRHGVYLGGALFVPLGVILGIQAAT